MDLNSKYYNKFRRDTTYKQQTDKLDEMMATTREEQMPADLADQDRGPRASSFRGKLEQIQQKSTAIVRDSKMIMAEYAAAQK